MFHYLSSGILALDECKQMTSYMIHSFFNPVASDFNE